MSEKKKLPPFQQAAKNIKVFAENVNLYESVYMMVQAANSLEVLSEDPDAKVENDELDEMLNSTLRQFSHFLEEKGESWN